MRDTTLRTRKATLVGLPALLVAALLSACGSESGAGGSAREGEPVEFKIADYLPEGDYHIENGLQVFMEKAEELSDGTITFEHYPAEQLAAGPDLLDATGSGLADISLLGVTYHTDKLPLAGVCALPGSFTTVTQGTEACWEVVQSAEIEEEFLKNGVRPLYTHVNEPYGLQTRKARVEQLEDLKGMKLRSGGGDMSRLISRMGAVPVEMSGPETYEGVRRGTLDGILYPVLSIPPYDLGGPLDYGITGINLGSFLHTAAINEQSWQSLSQTQREALMAAGEEAMDNYARWVDENSGTVIEQIESEGDMEFYELPQDEMDRWNEHAKAINEQWASAMEERGFAGNSVWATWEEALGNS
jgi:TRAP-type C4-dicarboxylate transport system substrate-binding protein